MPTFAVILPAAGSSARFGRNKLTETLAGTPVIAHSIRAFTRRDDVSHIVIPTQNYAEISDALTEASPSILIDKRLQFCPGGASRAESVNRALRELPTNVEWIAIHDAARPLISQALIDATLAAARQYGAAVPALPIGLTVKEATAPLPARVEHTVPRHNLWTMQTPQIMRRADLIEAFAKCSVPLDQITDDAQLLELNGRPVFLIEGEETNIKLTTLLDLQIAIQLLHP